MKTGTHLENGLALMKDAEDKLLESIEQFDLGVSDWSATLVSSRVDELRKTRLYLADMLKERITNER